MDFIRKMEMAYAAADIVISRAGAIAISELCLAGKPCILVPSPNVAEDHQTKNAMALVSNKAALMVTDAGSPENLVSTAIGLVNNKAEMQELSKNITQLGKPGSARQIAQVILNHIKNQ